MEIRFSNRANRRNKSDAGMGEIYSYAQMDGEVVVLVRLPDHSIVTARVPQEMERPEIGQAVELVHQPAQAPAEFLASVNL